MRIARDVASAFTQGAAAGVVDVPANDALTGSNEPIRQRAPHEPKADQTDCRMPHHIYRIPAFVRAGSG